ncbi:MAG: hypothetical protein U5O39_16320 [Gammaproteobacteria bacterium]|nr:hypothetical protein [Gammaproteobacteria bacterium]
MPPPSRLWSEFAILMVVLGLAGLMLEPAATTISAHTGLTQTIVGVMLTAVSTSIPELVTSIAAVRRGALTLAVGGILGGNAFDTLFMAASDIAYRDGSIYHAMPAATEFWCRSHPVDVGLPHHGTDPPGAAGPGGHRCGEYRDFRAVLAWRSRTAEWLVTPGPVRIMLAYALFTLRGTALTPLSPSLTLARYGDSP